MKIVISSWWFPACVALWLDKAARRAGHEVVRVGPSSGAFTGWSELPPEKRDRPDLAVTSDLLASGHPDFGAVDDAAKACDLWIDVAGGWFVAMHVPAKRRVLVLTDPHCGARWSGTDEEREVVHQTYSMQSNYGLASDGWLPYAYDPTEHFPDVDAPQTYDVTILGAPYPKRQMAAKTLRESGLRVLGPGRGYFGEEYRLALCAAPIAVVIPMKDDLPCRVFEAMACGRVVVTPDVPDLLRLPALRAASRYAVGQANGWLEQAGPLRVRDDAMTAAAAHTWDARLAQLIEGRLNP